AVSVTVGLESHAHITGTGGNSQFDISVTQTDSDANVILLEDISAAQNVNVDITAFGASEATVIKTFDAEDGFDVDDNEWNCGEGDYNTHLQVKGEGGIDTLTIRAYREDDGEASIASEVSVVVDDAWGVAGEG